MESIDRLRKYVTGGAGQGISIICEKNILKDLDSIEQEVDEMWHALTIDAKPMTDENMAESGWVRLPLDAEGEAIHIGDVMEWPDCSTAEVVGIGDDTFFYVEDGEDAAEWSSASDKIHHHAPTVESVLAEMLDAWGELPSNVTNEAIIAKYAAKLQLKED